MCVQGCLLLLLPGGSLLPVVDPGDARLLGMARFLSRNCGYWYARHNAQVHSRTTAIQIFPPRATYGFCHPPLPHQTQTRSFSVTSGGT